MLGHGREGGRQTGRHCRAPIHSEAKLSLMCGACPALVGFQPVGWDGISLEMGRRV